MFNPDACWVAPLQALYADSRRMLVAAMRLAHPESRAGPATMFLSLDFEWWERAEDTILEVGWSLWDTVTQQHRTRHWVIKENLNKVRRCGGTALPVQQGVVLKEQHGWLRVWRHLLLARSKNEVLQDAALPEHWLGQPATHYGVYAPGTPHQVAAVMTKKIARALLALHKRMCGRIVSTWVFACAM